MEKKIKNDIEEIKEQIREIDRNIDIIKENQQSKDNDIFTFKDESNKLTFILCSCLMGLVLLIALMIYLYKMFA